MPLPNKYNEDFHIYAYHDELADREHVALVHGDIAKAIAENKPIMVRVHSESFTGDVFGSLLSTDGNRLEAAIEQIRKDGCGIIVYLRQEERGISDQLKSIEVQDEVDDATPTSLNLGFPADLRTFGVGAQILSDLGLKEVKILTNNPKKIHGISGYGLKVVERVPLQFTTNVDDENQLNSPENKLGQML